MTLPRTVRLENINKPVIIQDIVIISPKHDPKQPTPTGEFHMTGANEDTQLSRLYITIEDLVKEASQKHNKNKENKNHITRLVTNEFVFYTKKPLSLKEFEQLQQQIALLAQQSPENLHLVLSSFAVQTPDDKLMDVVAHFQCGENARMDFIVKNNSSDNDPVYTVIEDGKKRRINNIDRDKGDQLDSYKITINGAARGFSYKNIIQCITMGDVPFYTGIDICLDHKYAVALNTANEFLKDAHEKLLTAENEELLARFFSHILTSNVINVKNKNSLGTVTHADPIISLKECKEGTIKSSYDEINPLFGMSLTCIETSPMVCNEWPSYQLAQVEAYNNAVLEIGNTSMIVEESKKVKTSSSYFDASDMLSELNEEEEEEADLKAILNRYLSKLIQYYSKNKKEKKSQLVTWMSKQENDSPDILEKNKYLESKLRQLQSDFKRIIRSNQEVCQKAEQAHKILKIALDEIVTEDSNLYKSKAYKMCEKKIKKLEEAYPSLTRSIDKKL